MLYHVALQYLANSNRLDVFHCPFLSSPQIDFCAGLPVDFVIVCCVDEDITFGYGRYNERLWLGVCAQFSVYLYSIARLAV